METDFSETFLGGPVVLTDLRLHHILEKHPEVLKDGTGRIADVLRRPEYIRRSARDPDVVLLSRWYDGLLMGKHLVVVVAMSGRQRGSSRILTAYAMRDLGPGEVLWPRS